MINAAREDRSLALLGSNPRTHVSALQTHNNDEYERGLCKRLQNNFKHMIPFEHCCDRSALIYSVTLNARELNDTFEGDTALSAVQARCR